MKIRFLLLGKTNTSYLQEGIEMYVKRIQKYNRLEIQILSGLKKSKYLSPQQIKEAEGEQFLQQFQTGDFIVLLDEKGKSYNSLQFAGELQTLFMQQSYKQLTFVCGGAYGFSDAVYKRANKKLSLSKMTFSHQLIRLVFLEQLYRAFTILKNEPYHNE